MPSCCALGSASSRSRIFSVSSAVAPRCSRSSPRGPNATFAFACVATAPALALAYGTTLPTLKNRDATATPSSFVFGSRATMEKVATSCAYADVARNRKARIALRMGRFYAQKIEPRLLTGARFRWRREFGLAGLDAAAVRVRPLVLVAEAAGADERRRGPRALVVGFVAATIEPRIAEGVGDGLTGFVADEVLLVLDGREAADGAAAAARPRLDRVLHVLTRAVDVVAVIRAVGQARAAAGGRGAVGRVRGAREEHFVDRVVVDAVRSDVPLHFGLNRRVRDVGRRRGRVEPVGLAAGERAGGDVAVAADRIFAVVLGDRVVLTRGAELIAERLQRRRVRGVGYAAGEGGTPENQNHVGITDDRATGVVGKI